MSVMWEGCNDPRELLRRSEKHLKQERFRWLAAVYVDLIQYLGYYCPEIGEYWTIGFLAWVRGEGPIPTGVLAESPDYDYFPRQLPPPSPVDVARETMFRNMQERKWAHLAVNAIIVVADQYPRFESRPVIKRHRPKSASKLARYEAELRTQRTAWSEAKKSDQRVANAAFCNSFRDVAGNPFEPVEFEARWRTDTVMALARGIHAEAAFDRMPILADAMEEAGCNHPTILHHCRGQQSHVRGCWVISELFEDQWDSFPVA